MITFRQLKDWQSVCDAEVLTPAHRYDKTNHDGTAALMRHEYKLSEMARTAMPLLIKEVEQLRAIAAQFAELMTPEVLTRTCEPGCATSDGNDCTCDIGGALESLAIELMNEHLP